MGYVGVACMVTVLTVLLELFYMTALAKSPWQSEKQLKVTIPETLDYEGVFDDIFKEYTLKSELVKVRSIHMGSLFQLEYRVRVKNTKEEKAFIDALRCRNGNLDILLSRTEIGRDEI